MNDRAQWERKRAADAAEETTGHLSNLLRAMQASLLLAEETRQHAERSETRSVEAEARTGRLAFWTLIAAFGSLLVSATALFVALVK